jgi:hypothetical protein
MNQFLYKTFLILLFGGLTACNFISDNTSNFIFTKSSPTSLEYKNELAEKLKSNSNAFAYTFNKYLQQNDKEYLDIKVKSNEFEATLFVLVNNWNKIEGIQRTKGLGYSGAELKGLQLDIQQTDSGAVFIYKDLERIID